MPETSPTPHEVSAVEPSKRLVIAGPSASLIARLRGGLIRECISRKIAVVAMAPAMRAQDAQALTAMGAETVAFALKPETFSIWPERKAIAALANEMKQRKPDAVLAFGTVAPFAVRAAAKADVPNIGLMVSEMPDGKLGRRFPAAMRKADKVFVHNSENVRAIRAAKISKAGTLVLVPGAGADLQGFCGLALPPISAKISFIASARLDRVKGVLEYLEAARIVRSETEGAVFYLTGPEGEGSGAVQTDVISRYADCVTYLGDATDLRDVFNKAHVFVSPSHLEGMPHAVLQAMAAGRPIIATDIPGSRETVDEMANGTLVAPRSANALAEGISRLLKHKDLLPSMSRASRAKAERLFAMTAVNATILEALKLS